jgi:hypothetical protein
MGWKADTATCPSERHRSRHPDLGKGDHEGFRSAKGEHREPIAPGSFAYAQQHLDHFNGFYPLPFSLFGKLYPARLSFTQEF